MLRQRATDSIVTHYQPIRLVSAPLKANMRHIIIKSIAITKIMRSIIKSQNLVFNF